MNEIFQFGGVIGIPYYKIEIEGNFKNRTNKH